MHDRSGRDRRRLAPQHLTGRWATCRRRLDDDQPTGRVCGTHGESVHRRAVERRQVEWRLDRPGEHPPEGAGERDALGLDHADASEDELLRFGDPEQSFHRRSR
jgi:hypothetical protein